MIEIVFLCVLALCIGFVIGKETNNKESKTLEQVDAELRKELAIAKNLNESLMQDIRYLRSKK
jgi:hypothetical protein